jgi:leukotriene-A4 hydrolase
MFPSQDTPAIKSTYSAKVKSILPVLMSGLRQSPPPEQVLEPGTEVEYVYDQVSHMVFYSTHMGHLWTSLIYF